MKRHLALILVLSLVLTILAGCSAPATDNTTSSAPNTLDTVLKRGHLIVGTGSNNPPWHFKDDSGTYQGFDVEMARILARALFKDETKVEFVEQTSDSRIPNVLSGKVDITIQFMTISAERAQQVAFSMPYYTEGSALMLAADGKYESGEDLDKAAADGAVLKIGVLQNAYADDIVKSYYETAVAEQFEEQAMVIQALTSGVIDAAAIDASNVAYQVALNPNLFVNSGRAAYPQNYGFAMRPDDQIWINFVNTMMTDAMTGNDFALYQAAFTKWFGESDQLSEPTIGMPKIYRNNNN